MKTKEERKQRKAERKRKPHFVRHSFGMAFGVIFLGAAIVIPQITMPFNGMLQGFMGDMDIDITEKKTQDILNQGKDLSMDIEREGAVLLKNENETLPLAKDVNKVNVFGWASTQWLGGGSGSGQIISTDETILTALKNYGIEYNEELEKCIRISVVKESTKMHCQAGRKISAVYMSRISMMENPIQKNYCKMQRIIQIQQLL